MNWIEGNRLAIGILADSLTLAGAAILARDALLRLNELERKRADRRFRNEFPLLNLADEEWKSVVISVRWALGGFVSLLLGFILQLLLRIFGRT